MLRLDRMLRSQQRLSAIGYQLSAISYQLSAISYQLARSRAGLTVACTDPVHGRHPEG